MRIGIFGGSFDPIHRGHIIVAAAAANALGLDRVWFVPARSQPFKGEGHVAAPHHRVEMVRRAIAADPRFLVDDREVGRSGPSYTIDTLQAIRTDRPKDELFLLVGADAARDFPAWRDAKKIARLAHVVVLTRPGVEPLHDHLIERILLVPAVEISASEVRQRVSRNESIRHLVPPAVADYIGQHGLYRRDTEQTD